MDSDGPPAQSRIRVKRFEKNSIRTTAVVDAAGRFEMHDLPPRKYEVRLQTPPPAKFSVFEGNYALQARTQSGEIVTMQRLRVRSEFAGSLPLGDRDRISGAFDIMLESALEQQLLMEVHALDASPEEDAALDALSEVELAGRLSTGTLVHTLQSANAHEGLHQFGCNVDTLRRWVFSLQLASGKRYTFAMPRAQRHSASWYQWSLGKSGPRLTSDFHH